MKKTFFTILMVVVLCGNSFAQEQGKFRGGFDLGYAIPVGGGGVSLGAEAKYNLRDNMNVGIRWTMAFMAKEIGSLDANVSASSGYLATFDYYFLSKRSSKFSPFIGGGVGMYSFADMTLDFAGIKSDIGGLSNELGGIVRAGFEFGKFRLSAEYTILPDAKVKIDQSIGTFTVINSYFGINCGVYFGGGKWNK